MTCQCRFQTTRGLNYDALWCQLQQSCTQLLMAQFIVGKLHGMWLGIAINIEPFFTNVYTYIQIIF